MARGKKRQFVNGKSQDSFADCACIPVNGFFTDEPVDDVGFSDEILNILKRYEGIYTVRSLMVHSSIQLRRCWSLREYMPEVLDTIDEYLIEVIGKRRKEYYDNPVPVYTLLGVKDISRYANCLLYDFNRMVLHYVPGTFDCLRANGIITLQDFLKLDLAAWHRFDEWTDTGVRVVLRDVKRNLRSASKLPSLPYPLDSPGKEAITFPLPEEAREKVSSLTDDRLAGDKVSLKGLSPYEKALYNRAKDAIDDCTADFYYDILDFKEPAERLAQSLALFCSPEIELMQRRAMICSLYLAVPDRIRKMPARALCHYMMPRYTHEDRNWPYRDRYNSREVVFFQNWQPFSSGSRMISLEDAFAHFEELMNGCRVIDELDRLIDEDRDMQFIDLLHWLSHATMLNGVYDSFFKPPRQHSHEASKQMQQLVPETDPDKVIAFFSAMKKNIKGRPEEFSFYYAFGSDISTSIWETCYAARYDFFSVYMLLTGRTCIPAAILDGFLYESDAECYKKYFIGSSSSNLYEYSAETGMVTIRDETLQR